MLSSFLFQGHQRSLKMTFRFQKAIANDSIYEKSADDRYKKAVSIIKNAIIETAFHLVSNQVFHDIVNNSLCNTIQETAITYLIAAVN